MSKKNYLKRAFVPKESEARDAVAVLLEDVRHDFKVFGDGLDLLRRQMRSGFKEVRSDIERVESRIGLLETEVRSLRTVIGTPQEPKIITRGEFLKLSERLRKVEDRLARLPTA